MQKPSSRLAHWPATVLGASLLACTSAHAGPLVDSAIEETKLFVTAPLRWDSRDWTYFGATALAVAAAHEYDDNVRDHFRKGSTITGEQDPHSSRDWRPAAAMLGLTWAYATLVDDRGGYAEGRTMIEAAAFSALTSEAFKLAAGRLRPFETSSSNDWRESGDSFPSSHASITFAIGTVLAESGNDDYRWVRRAIGYGSAIAVAHARVQDGAHWLSDTVAGAALGIATAHFSMHRGHEHGRNGTFAVTPLPQGAALTYNVQFN